MGCDHNGDLKSSTTAQNENQDERAYHGNDQGTDAPEAVGEECEHLAKSALRRRAVFTCYRSRSRPMASKQRGSPIVSIGGEREELASSNFECPERREFGARNQKA